ncbi:MAG: hypothetical protein NTY48_05180 [Candidatus Diapherotrites archaeon]|nr:hypothetical protein [Candidatus Diapherotrites archaeon]
MRAGANKSAKYNSYLARTRSKSPLTEQAYQRIIELTRNGEHTATNIAKMIPGVRPRHVIRVASKTNGSLSNARGIIRDRELVDQYFYMRGILRNTLPVIERELGISQASASRLDKKLLGSYLTRRIGNKNVANGKAHKESEFIARLLKEKNPDDTYKFSISMIARAFGVDKTVVKGANRRAGMIRTQNEIKESLRQFKSMTRDKNQALFYELLEKIKHLRQQQKLFVPPTNPLKLSPQKRQLLKQLILQNIEELKNVAPERHKEQYMWAKIEKARIVIETIFSRPGLFIKRKELAKILRINDGQLDSVLEPISQKHGIGSVLIVKGYVALNPETTHYLNPLKLSELAQILNN